MVTQQECPAFRLPADPHPRQGTELSNRRQCQRFRTFSDSAGQRMIRTAFQRRRETQDIIVTETIKGMDFRYLRHAFCQGPGFVENNGVESACLL